MMPSVQLRILLVSAALLVLPAVSFAFGKSHQSAHPIGAPGTAYVTQVHGPSGYTLQETVAWWLRAHPAGACQIQKRLAVCTHSATMVVLVGMVRRSYSPASPKVPTAGDPGDEPPAVALTLQSLRDGSGSAQRPDIGCGLRLATDRPGAARRLRDGPCG